MYEIVGEKWKCRDMLCENERNRDATEYKTEHRRDIVAWYSGFLFTNHSREKLVPTRVAGEPISKLTSSLMTVALLSDRRADVILRPRSAKTMFGRFFFLRVYVRPRKNCVLRLAVRTPTYKICHHVPTWPTRHDDTSGGERATTSQVQVGRARYECLLVPAVTTDISHSHVAPSRSTLVFIHDRRDSICRRRPYRSECALVCALDSIYIPHASHLEPVTSGSLYNIRAKCAHSFCSFGTNCRARCRLVSYLPGSLAFY